MINNNIERIQRLLNLNNILNVSVGYDYFYSLCYLKFRDREIHLFPSYNQNSIDKQEVIFAKLLATKCTAVVPLTNIPLTLSKNFKVLERPNLFTIDLSSELNSIWSNVRKKRQNSIELHSNLLRFEIADKDDPLVDVFVELYLDLQIERGVPLINFFDSVALYTLIKTSGFRLFYAINVKVKNSILFHLVRENGNRLEYLFSANSDFESRGYSAYLHWHIINWSKCEQNKFAFYDLGGGIVKNDGVERFKKEIGGVAQSRWYLLYPVVEYIDGVFFPSNAGFLNKKNFNSN